MAPNRPLLPRAAGQRRPGPALFVLGALAFLALAGCGRKPMQVTYYYKTGTPGLSAMIADVAALEKEFPGKVVTRSIDASTPDAQADLTHLEIGTSGIAVRNSNSVMVFKQGGSTLDMKAVRAAIRGALGIKAP